MFQKMPKLNFIINKLKLWLSINMKLNYNNNEIFLK